MLEVVARGADAERAEDDKSTRAEAIESGTGPEGGREPHECRVLACADTEHQSGIDAAGEHGETEAEEAPAHDARVSPPGNEDAEERDERIGQPSVARYADGKGSLPGEVGDVVSGGSECRGGVAVAKPWEEDRAAGDGGDEQRDIPIAGAPIRFLACCAEGIERGAFGLQVFGERQVDEAAQLFGCLRFEAGARDGKLAVEFGETLGQFSVCVVCGTGFELAGRLTNEEAWLDQAKVVPAQIVPATPPKARRNVLPLLEDVVVFPAAGKLSAPTR